MKKRLLSCVLAGAMIVAMLAAETVRKKMQYSNKVKKLRKQEKSVLYQVSFLYQKNRLQLKL